MYYVEAIIDGETVLLQDLDPSSNVKLQSGKIHPALNAISDFTFTLLQNHPQFGKLKPFKTLLRVTDEKGNIFWRGRVLDPTAKMSNNGLMYIDYTAEDELAFLLDSKQRHGEFHDITPKQYLQIILDNHNQSVAGDSIDKTILLGNVNVTNSTDNVYRYLSYDTSLNNILEDLLSSLGGYISLRYEGGKRYLDYLTDSGTTSQMSIALADNLKSIESQQNPSEIITRLIPLGAYLEDESGASKPRLTIKSVNDNKDYIDDPELVAQYGIVEGFVIWDDVTQPSNLKAKGQAWLSNQRLTDSVTITAADLSLIDESYESFKLGNFYRAENKELGIDRLYRLSAQEIDILNPLESALEFGDRKTSLTNYSGGFVGQKELAETTSQTLQKARDNATELINAATTGHVVVRPHEILIMDTDEIATAQNVWRWNQNGLGHSKNGYNGPYNLAMTKDGKIVADRITVGTLLADLIKAGILKSINGESYINMETGQASLRGSLTTVSTDGKFNAALFNQGISLYRNNERVGWFQGFNHERDGEVSWLKADRIDGTSLDVKNIYLTEDTGGVYRTKNGNRRAFISYDTNGISHWDIKYLTGDGDGMEITNVKNLLGIDNFSIQRVNEIWMRDKSGKNYLAFDTSFDGTRIHNLRSLWVGGIGGDLAWKTVRLADGGTAQALCRV